MGGFLSELKRRHIYRVAAAYAVVAWVLLQLVNNIAPALRIPDWGISLVLVLLLVGFPVALLFAWIHQLAPENLLEQAVARDPNYAPAWAVLAQAFSLFPAFSPAFFNGSAEDFRRVIEASFSKAEAAARQAILLDPNSADGYTALGTVRNFRCIGAVPRDCRGPTPTPV